MALPIVLVYDASTARTGGVGRTRGSGLPAASRLRSGAAFWAGALHALRFLRIGFCAPNDRTRGMALRAVLPGLQRLSDATLPSTGRLDKAWTGRTAVGTRATLPAARFEKGLRGITEDRRPRVRLPRRAGQPRPTPVL